jgi:SnoaL-like domain
MAKRSRAAVVAAFVVALAGLPSAAAAGDTQLGCETGFEEVSQAFDQAFIERDFDTFMAFIAEDAIQVDYLAHVFLGKDEIAAFTRAVMANDYVFTHTLIDQTLRPCTSASVLQDTVFSIPSRGLSLHLLDAVNWARVDGEWQAVMIQNTEFPA